MPIPKTHALDVFLAEVTPGSGLWYLRASRLRESLEQEGIDPFLSGYVSYMVWLFGNGVNPVHGGVPVYSYQDPSYWEETMVPWVRRSTRFRADLHGVLGVLFLLETEFLEKVKTTQGNVVGPLTHLVYQLKTELTRVLHPHLRYPQYIVGPATALRIAQEIIDTLNVGIFESEILGGAGGVAPLRRQYVDSCAKYLIMTTQLLAEIPSQPFQAGARLACFLTHEPGCSPSARLQRILEHTHAMLMRVQQGP